MLSFHLHKIALAYQHDYIFSTLTLFFVFLSFSRATPMAYGGSQAAGLHHSHSNMGPKPCLKHTPELTAMLNP